jgi:GT2 family glycosyltransferase
MSRTGIVIVTYNSCTHIPRLMRGLEKTLSSGKDVVCVVDNASTDGSADLCRELIKGLGIEAFVLNLENNVGFAAANNRGVALLEEKFQKSGLDNFVFLNPDTVPQEGWLRWLTEESKKTEIGSVAALLLLPDGTLNSRGNALHISGFGMVTGYGEPVSTAQDRSVFFGTGAALLVSSRSLGKLRELSGELGPFWEELFLYGEDLDLGWRLQLAGLENRVCVQSRVVHYSSFIGKKSALKSVFYLERNRWLVLFANLRMRTLLLLLPLLFLLEVAMVVGGRCFYTGSRFSLYREIWREVRQPEFRARRRRIQSRRKVGDRDILRRMQSSIRHGAIASRRLDGLVDWFLSGLHRCLIYLVRW